MAIKQCVVCGGDFEARTKVYKYCSKEHRAQGHASIAKKWSTENRDKRRQIGRRHYAKNKDAIRARAIQNNEEQISRLRRWKIANPDKLRKSRQKDRERYREQRAALRLLKEIEANGIGALL